MRPYPASRMGPGGCPAGEPGSHHVRTSRHARRSAADSSSIVPRACTPALVTSTSSRPYTESARSTSPATASSSVTSHAWPSTGRPVWAVSRPAACSQRSADGWPAARRRGSAPGPPALSPARGPPSCPCRPQHLPGLRRGRRPVCGGRAPGFLSHSGMLAEPPARAPLNFPARRVWAAGLLPGAALPVRRVCPGNVVAAG